MSVGASGNQAIYNEQPALRKIRIGRERFIRLIMAISKAEHLNEPNFNELSYRNAEDALNNIQNGVDDYWKFLLDFFVE